MKTLVGNYPPVADIKIRTIFNRRLRLLTIFSFVTALLYSVIAISIFISLSKTHSTYLHNRVEILIFLKELDLTTESALVATRSYVTTKDPQYRVEVEKLRDKTTLIFSELKARFKIPEGILLFSKLQTETHLQFIQMEEILKRPPSGNSQELITWFNDKVRPLQQNYVLASLNLYAYINRLFKETQTVWKASWRKNLRLLFIIGLMSVAIFIALFWALSHSIEQQRLTETERSISEMIAKHAVDLTGLGIFNHDQIRDEIYWSPQMRLIIGIGETEKLSLHDYGLLIPEEERPTIFNAIRKAHDPSGTGQFEVNHRLVHRDGNVRWVMVKSQTFFDLRNGKRVPISTIGAMLDLTNIKAVELSLRKTLDDLARKTQKLERSNAELEQVASIAAHDLRAPINSMIGWVEVLDQEVPKPCPEIVKKAVAFIGHNTRKADALIGDLLAVARINENSVNNEILDLNEVLADAMPVFKDCIEASGARIKIDPLPKIFGNRSHFDSLFSNLIRNAITYREQSRNLEISIRYQNLGKFGEFIVCDNGIGIEEKYQTTIFEMFKRLHSDQEYSGTGIGLAYCKKVVELSGGRIWAESKFGIGSEFHFTLPIELIQEKAA